MSPGQLSESSTANSVADTSRIHFRKELVYSTAAESWRRHVENGSAALAIMLNS